MGNKQIEEYQDSGSKKIINEKNIEVFRKAWKVLKMAKEHRRDRKFEESLELLSKSQTVFQKYSHMNGVAYCVMEKGMVFCKMSGTENLDKATDYYKKALKIFKSQKCKKGEAEVYNNLGVANRRKKKYKESLTCYNQSLAIKEALNDIKGQGKTLTNIANLCKEIGKLRDSLKYYEEALEIFHTQEDNHLYRLTYTEINKLKQEIQGEKKKVSARLKPEEEKENLKEQLEDIKEAQICIVCMENPKNTLFLPCKHLCVCEGCSVMLEKCPMCRQKITDKISAYM